VTPEVNVFWWFFDGADRPLCTFDPTDGSCLSTVSSNNTLRGIRDSLHQGGVKVFATITDMKKNRAGQLSAYIATPENREIYAQKITDWAVQAGVDGVDLDWENFAWRDGSSTWANKRVRWIEMIKVLGAKLHAQNLELSATVPGDRPSIYSDPTGTLYWLYAWDVIAPFVDRLRLMAYDYSFSRPGPIGPQFFADQVTADAVAAVGDINASKIWIGVAQYGRDWWARTDQDAYVTDRTCPTGWVPNEPAFDTLVPEGAATRAVTVGATVQNGRLTWDTDAKEWTYYYLQRNVAGKFPVTANGTTTWSAQTCNAKREVWYSGTRSAVARSALVDKYQIGGIAVWNLTDIQDDFYAKVGAYGRTIAQQPTTVTVTAPLVSRYGRTITVTAQSASSREIPGDSVATLYWGPTVDACCTKIAEGFTDSTGKVSFTATVQREGYWWIRVGGSWWRLPGINEGSLTRARFAVTASATNLAPKVGQDVRIFTVIQPAAKGTKVTMQKRIKGEWVNVRVLAQSTGGGASAHFTPRVVREIQFRFIATSANSYLRTISPVVTLAVRR
jgi:spore germination protein YaaH